MTPETLQTPPPASARRLVLATLASLVVAGVILVVAVLPAEYGIDPLGTGTAFGLVPAALPEETSLTPAASTPSAAPTPTVVGPIGYYPGAYATDRATFTLGPYEYVEYKYGLEQGASLLFSWEATAPVLHDFHGDPDGDQEPAEVSFDKRERQRASGTYTAPFAGMHGWFWENPGATPITLTIATSGFYSSAMEYRPNRRQTAHAITPVRP
jgi:hypothetical protein